MPQTEHMLEPGTPAIAVGAATGTELFIAHASGGAGRVAVGLTPKVEAQVEGYALWLRSPVEVLDDEIGHGDAPHLTGVRVGIKGPLSNKACYLAGLGVGNSQRGLGSTHADAGVVSSLPWDLPMYVRGTVGVGAPRGSEFYAAHGVGRLGAPLHVGSRFTMMAEVGAAAIIGLLHTDLSCWGSPDDGCSDDEIWFPTFSFAAFATVGVELGRPGPPKKE